MRTGKDGRVAVDLDLSRPGYRYELDVQRTDEADVGLPSHVSLWYEPKKPEAKPPRAIVWLAQPVYRPGEMVEFAGLVRQFDGQRLADYGTNHVLPTQKVEVAVGNRDGEIWRGPCEVSAAGTFHGRFRLPPGAGSGPCRFSVNNHPTLPPVPLVIDEFRVNTFDVRLTLPRHTCVAGERAEGEVSVTYFTGKAAAGAEVEVVAETGEPEPAPHRRHDGADGVFRFHLPVPESEFARSIVVRATVNDVSGQSYTAVDWILTQATGFRVWAAQGTSPPPPVRSSRWKFARRTGMIGRSSARLSLPSADTRPRRP